MTCLPKISVIVPVYGAEKYLCRCLDSIIAQTFTEFEIILVDDGSKDGSGIICDDYAKKDCRFHVVHKKNEGVSIARQTGLNMAQGEYVIHADPDDWVEPGWLNTLYHKIVEDNTDIVICDFEHITADQKVNWVQRPISLHKDDIIDDLLHEKVWGCMWNKLIRKECFSRYKVSFHPDMNLWEDMYVVCLLIAKGATVSYLPEVLYHYDTTINENGIVMHRKESHIRSLMVFIEQLSPILSDKRFDDGWFHVKSLVKKEIFVAGDCKYDIRDTYKEINKRYIRESKEWALSSTKRAVAVCLQTHSDIIGHLYYSLINRMKHFLGYKIS